MEYPFQMTVVDMFKQEGHACMVYADRLTGCLEVAHYHDGIISHFQRIKNQVQRYIKRWGAPDEIAMDGDMNLVSEESFFRKGGMAVRISSVQSLQSNGRVETAEDCCDSEEGH